MINLMKPRMPLSADLSIYLQKIDDSGVYSNFGPLSSLLISRLSDYFGVEEDQVVLMSNATLGLLGSISILSESGAGSHISLPSWTFTASASAALLAGCKARFEDIDDDWRVMDSSENAFLLDVLPFGDTLREASDTSPKTKFHVIDGAASFDALHNNGRNIPENSVLVISMHATKLVGAGEGGICIASSVEFAKELKSWSNFGFDGSRTSRRIGTNSKLSEYAAAVALASLDCWHDTREVLDKNRSIALDISRTLGFSVINSMTNGHVSPYWIMKFDSPEVKNAVVDSFSSHDIETRDWWGLGCHTMAAYETIERADLSKTVWASKTSLGLPFHAYLTDKDFELIFKALSDA
jgi:dTDP-4-amino-4,6-dideoxygalactose transaminase